MIRVYYTIAALAQKLPAKTIEAMRQVRSPGGVVVYRGREYFADPASLTPEYSVDQHQFYIRLADDKEPPAQLREVPCHVSANGHLWDFSLNIRAANGQFEITSTSWGSFKRGHRAMKRLAKVLNHQAEQTS